jgi:hypothetical protein
LNIPEEAERLLDEWESASQFAFDAQTDPDMGDSKVAEISRRMASVHYGLKDFLRRLSDK